MNDQSSTNRIYIKPGDIVDIVAPSSKCHPIVIEKFKALLASWGLVGRSPEDIFGKSLLYANSDEKRFSHLHYALTNQESKLIWCLLGGYGATRLIPLLNNLKPPPHSKQFIGFSDATALHIFLEGQWGWSTIHGPSGYQAALDKVSKDSISILKKIIFNENEPLSYDQIMPLNSKAIENALLYAPIIGGNLHMIQASIGTNWQIDTTEKILFIEETNERAYRIDRVLAHLNQAGLFKKVKAILFGDLIDKGEPDGKFLVMQIIEEFATQLNVPVLQIRNIGHGPINNPILLGSTAQLGTGNQCFLKFK